MVSLNKMLKTKRNVKCDNICSLKSIDIPFEDYLKMEFEMRYILQKSR